MRTRAVKNRIFFLRKELLSFMPAQCSELPYNTSAMSLLRKKNHVFLKNVFKKMRFRLGLLKHRIRFLKQKKIGSGSGFVSDERTKKRRLPAHFPCPIPGHYVTQIGRQKCCVAQKKSRPENPPRDLIGNPRPRKAWTKIRVLTDITKLMHILW